MSIFPSTDRKRRERLDARVPGLLIHRLTQILALQIRIRLHPSVGFDDFFGKCGRRQNLRHQRIRIQRNGRNQALQLLGSLRGVGRCLLALRILRWRDGWGVLRRQAHR